MTAEHVRLDEARDKPVPWSLWRRYLSERQWGTVSVDDSEGGDAWNDFSPDRGRSRAAMPLFATIKPEAVLKGGTKADFETRST
jgi:hypothetical protein